MGARIVLEEGYVLQVVRPQSERRFTRRASQPIVARVLHDEADVVYSRKLDPSDNTLGVGDIDGVLCEISQNAGPSRREKGTA